MVTLLHLSHLIDVLKYIHLLNLLIPISYRSFLILRYKRYFVHLILI